MSRQPAVVSFSTTNQSMWGTGTALSIDLPFSIIDPTTLGPVTVNDPLLGGLVDLSATASATFDLKADISGTGGSVSLKYPVNAYISLPDSVQPGGSLTVGTQFFSASSPDLKTMFPGLTFKLTLDASASLTGSLTSPFGTEPLSAAFNVSKDLLTLGAGLSHTFNFGGLSATVATPNPFTTESTSTRPSDENFPWVTSTGTSSDILSVKADVLKLLAPTVGIPPALLSGDLTIGNTTYGEYTAASVVLSGGIKIAQTFTFKPTNIDVTVTPNFDPSQLQTKPLGSSFTFNVPNDWSGPVSVRTSYSLEGNLVTKTGVVGHLDGSFTAGKFKLQAFYGDGTPLGIDIGPLIKLDQNFFTSSPVYFDSRAFPIEGFNTVDKSYTVPVSTTPIAVSPPNATGAFVGGSMNDPVNWGMPPDPDHPITSANVATFGGGTWSGTLSVVDLEFSGGSATLIGSLTVNAYSYIAGNLTIDGGALSSTVYLYSGGTLALNSGAMNGTVLVGDTGIGQFTQSAGTFSGGVGVGIQYGGQGTFTITTGDMSAAQILVGEHGVGTFNQSGGNNHYYIQGESTVGLISLGHYFDGTGTFNFSGGTITAAVIEVGEAGVGIFNQTGGSATLPDVLVGLDGDGTYNLHHGSLTISSMVLGGHAGIGTGDGGVGTFNFNTVAGDDATLTLGQGQSFGTNGIFVVGDLGTGIFNQGGGSIIAPHGVVLAEDFLSGGGPSEGDYELDGGSLTSNGNETIGQSGSGFFVQKGGSNTITDTTYSFAHVDPLPPDPRGLVLGIATNLGAYGSYELDGGSLSVAANEAIGDGGGGDFLQTAGSNSTGTLTLGVAGTEGGSYTQSGGTLLAAYEYIGYGSSGEFDQSGGTNTVGNGTVEKSSGAAVILGNTASGTYYLGGTGALNITGGLTVGFHAAGSAFYWNIDNGDAATLTISTGLAVGYKAQHATFVQGGGQLTVPTLDVGKTLFGSGDYQLYGDPQTDTLTVTGAENIGAQGGGGNTFEQEGGSNTATDLVVGAGTYYLDDGNLTAGSEEIGPIAAGELDQLGGLNTVNGNLTIGNALAFATGIYDLGGEGQLNVAGSVIIDNGTFYFNSDAADDATFTPGGHLVVVGVNQFGTALFVLGGGTLETSLDIGQNVGSAGTFEFDDGTLTAGGPALHDGSVKVGDFGQGTFTQTGLLAQISGTLDIAVHQGSTGTYKFDAGVIAAEIEIIGDGGNGSLLQTSGQNNVSGDIRIGLQAGSTGLLSVLGGTTDGNHLSIGESGGNGTLVVGSDSVVTVESVLMKGGLIDVLGGGSFGSGMGTGSLQVGTDDPAIAATVHIGDAGSFLGYGTIGGNLVDDGAVEITGGALAVMGSVTGTAAPIIDDAAALAIGGLESGAVMFNGGAHTTLKLFQPAEFTGLIEGLAKGNVIDLASETVTDATIQNVGDGTFKLNVQTDSADHFSFNIDGDVLGTHFTIKTDGSGGSDLILSGKTVSYDFDDHGVSDVLWRNGDGTVATWQTGGGSIQGHFLQGVSSDWHIEGAGDFDGDGNADMLWRNDDGRVIAWQMASSSQIASTPGLGTVPLNMHLAGIGDVDGDGRSDLLWRDGSSGAVLVQTMAGTQNTISTVGADWGLVGVGDFNGDGKDDVLFRNDASGVVAYWQMNGTTVQTTTFLNGVPLDWHVVGTGDFDGNGFSDIFWHNDNGANAVWLFAQGGAVASAAFFDGVGSDWHVANTGDYTGDGKDDVLWRSDSGATAIWQMDGGNQPTVSFPGGVPNDWAIQAHHYETV